MRSIGPFEFVIVIHLDLVVADESASEKELLEKVLLYLPQPEFEDPRRAANQVLKSASLVEGLSHFASRFSPEEDGINYVEMKGSILAVVEVEPRVLLAGRAPKRRPPPATRPPPPPPTPRGGGRPEGAGGDRRVWQAGDLLRALRRVWRAYALFHPSPAARLRAGLDLQGAAAAAAAAEAGPGGGGGGAVPPSFPAGAETGLALARRVLGLRRALRRAAAAAAAAAEEGQRTEGNKEDEEAAAAAAAKDRERGGAAKAAAEGAGAAAAAAAKGGEEEEEERRRRLEEALFAAEARSPMGAVREEMLQFFPGYISRLDLNAMSKTEYCLAGCESVALEPASILALTRLESAILEKFGPKGIKKLTVLLDEKVIWSDDSSSLTAIVVSFLKDIGALSIAGLCKSNPDDFLAAPAAISYLLPIGKKYSGPTAPFQREGDLGTDRQMIDNTTSSPARKKGSADRKNHAQQSKGVTDISAGNNKGFLTAQRGCLSTLNSAGSMRDDLIVAEMASIWTPDLHHPLNCESNTHHSEEQVKTDCPFDTLCVYFFGPLTFIFFWTKEEVLHHQKNSKRIDRTKNNSRPKISENGADNDGCTDISKEDEPPLPPLPPANGAFASHIFGPLELYLAPQMESFLSILMQGRKGGPMRTTRSDTIHSAFLDPSQCYSDANEIIEIILPSESEFENNASGSTKTKSKNTTSVIQNKHDKLTCLIHHELDLLCQKSAKQPSNAPLIEVASAGWRRQAAAGGRGWVAAGRAAGGRRSVAVTLTPLAEGGVVAIRAVAAGAALSP